MDEYRMESDSYEEIDLSNIYSEVEPDFIHNKMLLGSYIRGKNRLAYAAGVDGSTFLKFSVGDVHQYLLENCIFRVRRSSFAPLRIIKVKVSENGEYNVVDKTYYIRWIQRRWRSRLVQYKVDVKMLQNKYLYHRELHGGYPGFSRVKVKKLIGLLKS
jgi:hypothetical protein